MQIHEGWKAARTDKLADFQLAGPMVRKEHPAALHTAVTETRFFDSLFKSQLSSHTF